MSKIQLKVMGTLTLLIVVVVGTSGFLAERGLRERTTINARINLEYRARLFLQLVEDIGIESGKTAELQEATRSGAISAGARITLIDSSGRVLADSEVPLDELGGLSNHADRPEVVDALRMGIGHRLRRSDTLKRTLLYVALPAPSPESGPGVGIVRLAVYLDQLDAAVADLRSDLLAAAGVGLLVALGLSYGLSLLSLRPIIELREVVFDIAEGKLGRRLGWASNDERGEIAASINRVARQLRDQAEEALGEKRQLEAVLNGMVEGVIVVDRGGNILIANPRAREMLSVWGEYEGRRVPEVIKSPEIDEAIEFASKSEEIVVREIEVQAEKRRTLLMHASGFPDGDARTGTLAVFHDVSELRHVDRLRSDFIANASHELRTPLTSIQGFADTLANAEVDPEQRSKYLGAIVRNARRMSSLIDDLLTLSRIEGGESVLVPTSIDVGREIKVHVADFAPRFKEASIDVEVHADDVPNCLIDRDALDQILSNLLSNAARYSNAGSRVDIYVKESLRKNGGVEIRIEDTGIGIARDELERIFERFYRVDAARSRALGSTGLGLSIVKHLVRASDGELDVTSELGQGSCFSVTLPIG
jgi:two-component system phosphate regulon sensor histidine kinase PhoR